jgi:hypothetical protein
MTSSASPRPEDAEIFPALPLDAWRPTKETLHRFNQIVGKVALTCGIRRNHWWHMTFRLTPRGWTTVPLGTARQGPVFTLAFDFFDHVLLVDTDRGDRARVPLTDHSVASFYTETMNALHGLGIDVSLAEPTPYDLPDHGRPFAEDTEHREYDPVAANRAFHVYSQMGRVLEEFSASFSGKISNVQVFWHTFDLAVARFSPKEITLTAEVNPVTRESYSTEQISSGFWFGDDKVPAPTLYSYTWQEPEGIEQEPLRPAAAAWVTGPDGKSHNANLSYDAIRASADPVSAALDFYQSAYEAGSKRAGWDLTRLACWGGITDPVLRDEEPTGPHWPEQSGQAGQTEKAEKAGQPEKTEKSEPSKL